MLETKNGRTMLSSKCPACRNKKSRFIQKQEANINKYDLIVLSQVNEILLTVNKFHYPLMLLLKLINSISGKCFY